MIVLSNLFRRVMQYMIWDFTAKFREYGKLKADLLVISWIVHHVKIKSLPYMSQSKDPAFWLAV